MRERIAEVPDLYIAAFVADIHLSLNSPAARADEPNWLEAQARPFNALRVLLETIGHPPVFCAGDVFDRWNAPPELINWAIKTMPVMFAIPGQHDLPFHNAELLHKSAFWTLVEAGKLVVPSKDHVFPHNAWDLHDGRTLEVNGFGFGEPVPKCKTDTDLFRVAVTHQYLWADTSQAYPGAPEESRVMRHPEFAKWDLVVSGDNHTHFRSKGPTGNVLNCGPFQRRKLPEQPFYSWVHLLTNKGHVEEIELPRDEEHWTIDVEEHTPSADYSRFLEGLETLQGDLIDFGVAIRRAATNAANRTVARMLLESIGEGAK